MTTHTNGRTHSAASRVDSCFTRVNYKLSPGLYVRYVYVGTGWPMSPRSSNWQIIVVRHPHTVTHKIKTNVWIDVWHSWDFLMHTPVSYYCGPKALLPIVS